MEFPGTPTLPNKLYFRIGEVADIVGVDSHVLRYWEKEMEMSPHRSNSGQRLYRKADITQFMKIKHLVHDEGYTIGGARKALQEETQSLIPAERLEIVRTQLLDIKTHLDQLQQRLH